MNNIVVQNSIVNSILSHFGTGSILIDSIITIIISTLLVKLFNGIDSSILSRFFKYIYSYFYKEFVCEIKFSYSLSERGWDCDPDVKYNEDLIRSVENYMTKNNLTLKMFSLKLIENSNSGNLYEKVKSREMVGAPLENVKLNHPYSDITVNIYKEKTDGEKKTLTIKEKLTITSSKSTESIHVFIKSCYEDYIKIYDKYAQDIDAKYLYLHNYHDKQIRFNRYKIKDNTKFDKIFFPEKVKLLNTIDNFMENIYEDKLSFLLYGPPGTGKTSFIRAIANYTNRSIFYIKLSEIKTFEDGFNIFFKEKIHLNTGYHGTYYEVPLEKRVIVLEDIDVESTSCHNRESKSYKKLEKDISDSDSDGDSDDEKTMSKKEYESIFKPRLTLSDVLQLFDGIYRATGVIIVITTNNLNKLDPALTRPGRITHKINMREMTKENAHELINYYFPDNTSAIINEKFDMIEDYTITPAKMENMCKLSEDLDDLYNLLRGYYEAR